MLVIGLFDPAHQEKPRALSLVASSTAITFVTVRRGALRSEMEATGTSPPHIGLRRQDALVKKTTETRAKPSQPVRQQAAQRTREPAPLMR